jgi:hypothetical protein
MNLAEYPIAARGNLTCVQGKSKVGKSAVIAAILGACQRGACMHRRHALLRVGGQRQRRDHPSGHRAEQRRLARAGAPVGEAIRTAICFEPAGFHPAGPLCPQRACHHPRTGAGREKKEHGSIDAVVIDGVADLCASPNDEAESLELISRLHALAQEYATPIFCVLHENPFGEGKTRGHLGSELNRKAFANLRIEKDAETSVSTMWGMDMRKRDIPQNQGFCFGWDDDAGMHTFKGRAAGLKAAKKRKKPCRKRVRNGRRSSSFVAENGTMGSCPVLSPDDAANAIRDMNGTKNKPKADTIKKQMQRAEVLGVLKKADRGKWDSQPIGTNGT